MVFKNWFLTVSTYGSDVVGLIELIFHSFYFGKRAGGHEGIHFLTVFYIGEGVVILKELISKSFNF